MHLSIRGHFCREVLSKIVERGGILSEDWWSNWHKRRWSFFGGLNIDDFFREAEELMRRELKELSKSVPKELVHERVLPDGSRVQSWGPFVYGYSVTIGPDGKPRIREFGNVTPRTVLGKPKIRVKEKREPLIDVMESEGEIKVIAELPGVAKEEIDLTGTKTTLTLSVNNPSRKYYKELHLPCEVELESAKSAYKNGVLEVTLKKREEKPNGRKIEVD